MVTVTVAVAVPPLPSLMVYSKVNVPTPLEVLPAVYLRVVPLACVTVPLDGWVKDVMVSVSPSGSVSFATTFMFIVSPCGTPAVSLFATGGRFTVHVRLAGVGSVFPAASVARTSKVWEPPESPVYDLGEVHALHAPPSRRHWNVEPASLDVNEKLADGEVTVPDGPEVIVVSGGVVSAGGAIVHERLTGELVFPAASVARTSKAREPVESPEYDCGEEHALHAPPSSRHSKVEPSSLEVNSKVADVDVTVPDGPDVMVTVGGVVSGGGGGGGGSSDGGAEGSDVTP